MVRRGARRSGGYLVVVMRRARAALGPAWAAAVAVVLELRQPPAVSRDGDHPDGEGAQGDSGEDDRGRDADAPQQLDPLAGDVDPRDAQDDPAALAQADDQALGRDARAQPAAVEGQ